MDGSELALLIDFGSTYTKVVAVDLAQERILGWEHHPTTVETDITIGLRKALDALHRRLGFTPRYRHRLACSSAKGGLRLVAVGLVPNLTGEAARRAALGAGARVLRVFCHHLSPTELSEISRLSPDIILLAGGTNGGNSEVILHNARMLSRLPSSIPVVVAGNKDVADEVRRTLQTDGRTVTVTENVMPELGQLNVLPARQAIRELYINSIIEAKGFRKAERLVDRFLMPTPAAVLKAAQLLADGTEHEEGWGELIVVDVGGATTDVHSVAVGEPHNRMAIMRGLPEPYAKRTVEGDLGLRVSAYSLLESVGERRLREAIGRDVGDLKELTRSLSRHTDFVPRSQMERDVDDGMTMMAVEEAVKRHVGELEEVHLPAGFHFIQRGKDLTGVKHLIGTGGIFCYTTRAKEILSRALYDPQDPFYLRPKEPQLWVDRHYILWAMGLLSEVAPDAALRMMKKYLEKITTKTQRHEGL